MNLARHTLILCTLWICAEVAAQIQVDWTNVHEHPGQGYASYALELSDGSYIIATSKQNNPVIGAANFERSVGLLHLALDGSVIGETEIASWNYDLAPIGLFQPSSGVGIQLVALTFPRTPGERHGSVHYQISHELNVQSESHTPFPFPVLANADNADAILTPSGGVLAVLSMYVNSPNTPTHLWLQHLGPTGVALDSRIYFDPPDQGQLFSKLVTSCTSSDNGYWCSFRAAYNLGPPGFSKCLKFNEQLELVADTGFALPFPYSAGTSLDSAQYALGVAIRDDAIFLLESRRSFNYLSPNAPSPDRTVIGKYTTQGQLLGQYQHFPFAQDTYPSRRPVFLPNGNLVFAYNYGYIAATGYYGPTAVHLLQLNSDLDLVSSSILDGEADMAQYSVYEMIPTSDGGALLVGGVAFALEAQRYKPWIVKLSGLTTSVAERSAPTSYNLIARPNPGSSTLTLSTSEASPREGTLLVRDMLARTMARYRTTGASTTFDTAFWPAGAYFCTLVDSTGYTVANTRWIKE